MAQYVCIVQSGQAPEGKRAELETGLREIGEEAFGDAREAVEVRWIGIAEGFGFTAGEPSTSSIVVRSVPEGLPQDRRVAFMNRVCDLWQRVTGCSKNEIVVTAYDGPLPL